jgi:hypothetical protein
MQICNLNSGFNPKASNILNQTPPRTQTHIQTIFDDFKLKFTLLWNPHCIERSFACLHANYLKPNNFRKFLIQRRAIHPPDYASCDCFIMSTSPFLIKEKNFTEKNEREMKNVQKGWNDKFFRRGRHKCCS